MKRTKNDWFYVVMAIAMLLVNFIGFGQSFFFKSFFDTPELPFRTHLHGLIFTSWFVLLPVQAILVRRRKMAVHQRLGWFGALLALSMIISSIQILYHRALEFDGTEDSLLNTALVVSGNVTLLFLFSMFTGLGILFRTRPDWHKRFMLLASVAMMPQALGRLGRLPLPRLVEPVANEILFGLGGMLVLLIVILIHDLIQRGRLHAVSGFGSIFLMGMLVISAIALPRMVFMQHLILWINGAS